MALDFPSSPFVGQVYGNYTWDGEKWVNLDSSSVGSGGIFIQAGTGAVERTMQDKAREVFSVKDFGAVGDGVTDDAAKIQAALTHLRTNGGGRLHFPKGTYVVTTGLVVGSNTTLSGEGRASVIRAHPTAYVGANPDPGNYATLTSPLVMNFNKAAPALTDSDIVVENLAFSFGTVAIVNGGAHNILMRYVNRVVVRGCWFIDGENGTALIACKDTLTEGCFAFDQRNAGFDHWEVVDSGAVVNCVVRYTLAPATPPGTAGIQFNDSGSGLNTTSKNILISGNHVVGCKSTNNFAAGITCGTFDPLGSVQNVMSTGNLIEDCNVGLILGGGAGRHLSMGDTFRATTTQAITLVAHASPATASPHNSRVIDPHFIDCAHQVGDALIMLNASNCEVRGMKVTNTGSVLYQNLVRVLGGSNNIIEISDAPSGTLGRIVNSGTNTRVIDTFDRYDAGTYVPAITFGGAAVGMTVATDFRWRRIGKRCFVDGLFIMSAKGSSVGAVEMTLPFTAANLGGPGLLMMSELGGMANMSTAGYPIWGVTANTSKAALRAFIPASGGFVNLGEAHFTNSTFMYISGSYDLP